MLWIGHWFLVIRPNFGGDIQLYMFGMKGFFLCLCPDPPVGCGPENWRLDCVGRRFIRGHTKCICPCLRSSGKPCTAASQVTEWSCFWVFSLGDVSFMSQPESLVKLLRSLFQFLKWYAQTYTYNHIRVCGPSPNHFWGWWVDLSVYADGYPGSHGQITVIQNGNPMGTDQYLKYHMLGVDDI